MTTEERIEHNREEAASLALPTEARWVVYAERGAELLAAARLARRRAARREAAERRRATLALHGRAWGAMALEVVGRDPATGRFLPPVA